MIPQPQRARWLKTAREAFVLRHPPSGLYLPNALCGHLVEVADAYKFRTRKAAEKFLADNVEFKGYWPQRVTRAFGTWR